MFFSKELGRSLKRHGKKTAIALLVSAVLGVFLCQFSGSVDTYRRRLEELSQNADLRVTFVNSSGTRTVGLLVYDDKLQALEDSGLTEPGLYVAECLFSDGTEDDQPDIRNPKRLVQPIMAFTQEEPLAITPDNITYFDGYDASLFASSEPVCLLPQERFERLGYQAGDKVHIQLFTTGHNGKSIHPGVELDLTIAGTYKNTAQGLPPVNASGMVCPYLVMRQGLEDSKLNIWPSQAYLSIPDPENLNAVKALLEELEILPVNAHLASSARFAKTAIINDSVYIGTAEPTQRTLNLLQSLYPAVFGAVALIALLASYLLMQSRREEIALQRSLGAGKGRIFALFFAESACLCILGTAAACLLCTLAFGTHIAALGLPLLGYIAAYLVGAGAAILLMLRTGVLAVLAAAE